MKIEVVHTFHNPDYLEISDFRVNLDEEFLVSIQDDID